MTALEVFTEYYPQLLSSLPMEDVNFTALLFQKNLFPGNVKSKVRSRSTAQEGAEYFLDTVIHPPLRGNDSEPFMKLLSVMESFNSPSLQKLACTINQKLLKCRGDADAGSKWYLC